jgi:hypothetical protein
MMTNPRFVMNAPTVVCSPAVQAVNIPDNVERLHNSAAAFKSEIAQYMVINGRAPSTMQRPVVSSPNVLRMEWDGDGIVITGNPQRLGIPSGNVVLKLIPTVSAAGAVSWACTIQDGAQYVPAVLGCR